MAGDITGARNKAFQDVNAGERVSFALNRKAVGAEIDMHALRLMAILIKLIAQHRDRDHKRADDEIEDIGAVHGGLSFAGTKQRSRLRKA